MKSAKIFDLAEKINKALNNPGFPNISRLEYDLLLRHTQQFYEELILGYNSPVKDISSKSEKAKVTSEPESIDTRKAFQSNKNLLLDEPEVQKTEKPSVKEKPEIIKQEKVTVARAAVISDKKDKTATINDNAMLLGSLNEKLKTSSAAEVHKKMATKPLKDLIDLNKRFALLNELFKGNAEAFSAAVAHIDSLEDYNEAQAFIQSQLISNYFWDESTQTARLFMKLVRQKFGVE